LIARWLARRNIRVFPITPHGSQGRDMNKWYRPFGFMLLAAMASELCGCAQTSSWLAKRTSKKTSEQSVADAKKKSGDKKASVASSRDVADAKSGDQKNTATAAKAKPKSADSENTRLASASEPEAGKKSKPRVDPAVVEETLDSIASVKPTKVKSKAAEKSDDELDEFLSKIETPKVPKKDFSKKDASSDPSDELDTLIAAAEQAKKIPAQAKKEVAKAASSFDDDVEDWMDDSSSKHSKNVTPVNASVSESEDDEKKAATTVNADQKTVDSKSESDDALPDFSIESLKKTAIKKVSDSGLLALCANAEGELAAVLKGIDSNDPESLKQGLTQIGQLGAKGAAAAPLLQKLLKHEDSFVRTHAALAMAQLKLTTTDSVKVVTDALKSKDASLRSFGTAVLSEMGPQSNQVLTSLSECLTDKDGQVRLRAAEVLIRHDGFAYPALQCLLTSLKDKSENTRWLATYSLAELAPESPEAVQALLKASQDPASKVRVGAVYAIGEIGPYANRATDDLRQLLKTTDDEELKAAISSTLPKIAN
jgi:hypothetical protein